MTLSLLWTILFYAWILSEIIIAVATRTRTSTGNTHDRGSQLILWLVITSSITACELIRRLVPPTIPGGPHWIKAASVIVLVAGLGIRTTAVFTLGRSFSANVAIRASQTVHRTGLYQFVRHPSYLGLLLVFLAIGLYSANWLGLALAVLPTTAALLYRIQIEEAALTNAFGSEYVSYSKTAKRLIPGVY